MATSENPRGFVEVHGPSNEGYVRKRRVKVDDGHYALYAGDPVHLVSGNSVGRITAAPTAAEIPILGVVREVLNNDGRPFTHNLPGTPNRIAASANAWVTVNEDPNQLYLVNSDATVLSTHIGQYVDATANTPNTAAGRSGFSIELANAANTAAITLPFQIVALGDNNLDGFTQGEANHDVIVRVVNNVWGSKFMADPGKVR